MPVASPPRDADGRVVDEGDTLWRIASANTQGASVAQMMLAIQRANPDAFIRDNTITVGEMVKQAAGKTGENIRVRRFSRFNLGEGIEVDKVDFATEVASMGKAS